METDYEEAISFHHDTLSKITILTFKYKKKQIQAWYKAIDQLKPNMQTQYVRLEPEEAAPLLELELIKNTKRKGNWYIIPKSVCFVSLEQRLKPQTRP